MRDQDGITQGQVEISVDRASLRVEPVVGAQLELRHGRLVIASGTEPLGDDDISALRAADQR